MAITKKRDARRSVQQAAWITLDGGFASRACQVLDLSASGAKVIIDEPTSVNSRLRLGFTRDGRNGRPCEIVWRRGKMLGVKFTGA